MGEREREGHIERDWVLQELFTKLTHKKETQCIKIKTI